MAIDNSVERLLHRKFAPPVTPGVECSQELGRPELAVLID
jgi:hypothetical protein